MGLPHRPCWRSALDVLSCYIDVKKPKHTGQDKSRAAMDRPRVKESQRYWQQWSLSRTDQENESVTTLPLLMLTKANSAFKGHADSGSGTQHQRDLRKPQLLTFVLLDNYLWFDSVLQSHRPQWLFEAANDLELRSGAYSYGGPYSYLCGNTLRNIILFMVFCYLLLGFVCWSVVL